MNLIDEFFFFSKLFSSVQEENALKNFVKIPSYRRIKNTRRDVIFDMTEMKRIFQRDSLVTKVVISSLYGEKKKYEIYRGINI